MPKDGAAQTASRVDQHVNVASGAERLPFRESFGQPHMQAIFDRYADPDSRERIFSPTGNDESYGGASHG